MRVTLFVGVLCLAACSLVVPDMPCELDTDCGEDEVCVEEGFCLAHFGCNTRIGSQREDALLLGFIMTFSGPYAEGGIDQRKVVQLTVDEINENGGIQGLHANRELAFLACDDKANQQQTIDATKYLGRRGVPAVLGPGFSSLLKVAAEEAAIPDGTFLLSPSSTAVDIRDLEDNDLIWRVSSSDTQQANTLAYFALTEALKMQGEVTNNGVRVVAVHTQDIYGNGFRDSFETALEAYGLGFATELEAAGIALDFDAVTHKSESESEDWAVEIGQIIEQLEEKQPQILLFVGYDGTADILAQVKGSESLKALPLLLTDGASSTALATTYQSAEELPETLFGVQPGFRTGKSYEHFDALYGELVLPTWTEYTYDAIYLLAYAAAGIAPDAMTGAAFAEAFKRFDDPESGRVVNVGPDHYIAACQDMGDGLNLDVRGASGPLDFDLATGEPQSVGILRWTVGFSGPDEPGDIIDCGLAMVHEAGASLPTTYWCNAQCQAPPDTNTPCDAGYCEGEDAICASDLCTAGDDCKPATAP